MIPPPRPSFVVHNLAKPGILAGAPEGFYKEGVASSTAERNTESEFLEHFQRSMAQTPPLYGTAGLSPHKPVGVSLRAHQSNPTSSLLLCEGPRTALCAH